MDRLNAEHFLKGRNQGYSNQFCPRWRNGIDCYGSWV